MELLIFSDSHGKTDGMQWACDVQTKRPDGICFLGDGLRDAEAVFSQGVPLYAVRGNCDWDAASVGVPIEATLCFHGHKLLLTHGHMFGVKGGYGTLLSHAAACGADIVLCGHTHLPHEEVVPAGETLGDVTLSRPLYLFNPGSIGYDTDGQGRSFGTLLLRGDTVLFSHGRY
ncbi:MAG: metallophosphoesterase family protein [Clostridia bacterium]|nr:metallophosphoesterase family protein [Clostridia bacterium]